MKRFAGKISDVKPLYLIVAGVLVIVLIVGGVLLVAVGGDVGAEGPAPTLGVGEGDPSRLPGSRRTRPREAPVVRTGLLDDARREGRLAVAQARGTIVSPTGVRIRVTAAPRQTVTVNYQLGCFRNRRARVGRGSYRTRPPNTRGIPLPMSAPTSCIVTASAQLTKVVGTGLVHVSVIAGR